MACLLGQHGQISLGKTLEAAVWMGIEVETLARVIDQVTRMSYNLGPGSEAESDVARPWQA